DRPAVSALQITDDAYVINSFSKYFSMTGWRIGWMVVPADHVRMIERLSQNMFICAPHAAQVAALTAMECEAELEENLGVYARNRALMLERLPGAGFAHFAPPDGAFYIYADVSDVTDDSRAFAAELLDGAGVAVTPGLDFDPVRGRHTLRFSYARATADIEEGLARLAAYMACRAA
ncbi:MAG: aminotransferase class I/II-fold pyridoxal phosphate-dependent enzyme, partial [Pseudomonadota bacterium]